MKKTMTISLTVCLLVGLSVGLDAQRRVRRHRSPMGIYGTIHSRPVLSRGQARMIREIQRNEIRIHQIERRLQQLSWRRGPFSRSWRPHHEIRYLEREIRRLERRNAYLRSRVHGWY